MPAEVESMFYVREAPWHGLGNRVEFALSSEEALRGGGLNWTVIQKTVITEDFLPIPGYKANLRETDGRVLGVVTDRYKIVQNNEAFAFTDSLLGEGVRYETAGSLQNGKKVWILARLPENYIISGDRVSPYLVFSNSHDGSGSIKVAMTPIRVNNKVLRDIIDTLNKKKSNDLKPLEAELLYIDKQLEEITAKNKKYLKMFEDDLLDPQTIKERLGELQSESNRYKERKEEVLTLLSGNSSQEIPYEMVKSVFADFYNALVAAPDEHKKMLLQLIIKRITINDKREIDSIELFFGENIIKFFTDNEGLPSPDDGPSSCQKHKSLHLLVIRFTLDDPKPPINLLQ